MVRRPLRPPMETIACASPIDSSSVFINAPLPVLTSSTIAFEPAASFLLMIDEAISGRLSFGIDL